jgi:hypothetical protein
MEMRRKWGRIRGLCGEVEIWLQEANTYLVIRENHLSKEG